MRDSDEQNSTDLHLDRNQRQLVTEEDPPDYSKARPSFIMIMDMRSSVKAHAACYISYYNRFASLFLLLSRTSQGT